MIWQITLIITLVYFLLTHFDFRLSIWPVRENLATLSTTNTRFPEKPGYTQYHDIYRRDLHRYPFDSYSLYGLDDPYLPKQHLVKYQQPPFDQTIARLNQGHTTQFVDYTGLPSYFFRRYYGWPSGPKSESNAS